MQPLTLRPLQAFRRAQGPVQRQNLTAIAGGDLQWVKPGILGHQPAGYVRHQLQRSLEHFTGTRGDGHLVHQAMTLHHFANRQHGGRGTHP
ncbi:hypothetical protein D9M71_724940 [compost metagenome]